MKGELTMHNDDCEEALCYECEEAKQDYSCDDCGELFCEDCWLDHVTICYECGGHAHQDDAICCDDCDEYFCNDCWQATSTSATNATNLPIRVTRTTAMTAANTSAKIAGTPKTSTITITTAETVARMMGWEMFTTAGIGPIIGRRAIRRTP